MHRQNDVLMKSQLSRNFGALYIYCRMHPAVVISYHVWLSFTSYKKCDLFFVSIAQIQNSESLSICGNLQKYTKNPAYSMRICRKITSKLTLFVWASEKFCKKRRPEGLQNSYCGSNRALSVLCPRCKTFFFQKIVYLKNVCIRHKL